MVDVYAEETNTLTAGLMKWLQDQLPLTNESARALEEAEHTLRAAVSGIDEAEVVVDLRGAARRHAMGDRKALLALPVEVRRLVA
jgi:hypothetical protein